MVRQQPPQDWARDLDVAVIEQPLKRGELLRSYEILVSQNKDVAVVGRNRGPRSENLEDA